MSRNHNGRLDLDSLREVLGLPDLPDVIDNETYGYAYREALAEGMEEADADAFALKAEQYKNDERFNAHYKAVLYAASEVFGDHGLALKPSGPLGKRPWAWRVVPVDSWTEAATCILDTINGVGIFEFASVREFCASIPDTPRGTVLSHLHWMKRRADVYGDSRRSPLSLYRFSLR